MHLFIILEISIKKKKIPYLDRSYSDFIAILLILTVRTPKTIPADTPHYPSHRHIIINNNFNNILASVISRISRRSGFLGANEKIDKVQLSRRDHQMTEDDAQDNQYL